MPQPPKRPWPQDHGGGVHDASNAPVLRDFSASINPLGHPEGLEAALLARWSEVLHYPDRRATAFRRAVARRYGIDPELVLPGNGTAELIDVALRGLATRRVLLSPPDFGLYERFCPPGVERVLVPRIEAEGFAVDAQALGASLREGDTVLFSNPGNPSGAALSREAVLNLARRAGEAGAVLLVDEAFADFCPEISVLDRVGALPGLAVLRSLTKFYGVPGVRVGFLAAPPALLDRAAKLLVPWSMSVPAQIVGEACLADDNWAAKTRDYVERSRERLLAELRRFPGFVPLPSAANYVLVRLDPPAPDATELYEGLAAAGTLVRHCGSFGLGDRYVRIAVRTVGETVDLGRHLQRLLGGRGA